MGLIVSPRAYPRYKSQGARLNWSHPATNGIVGYWGVTEGGGQIMFDASGQAGSVIPTGTTFAPGPWGLEQTFNGSSDLSQLADNTTLRNPSSALTLITALRITGNPGDGAIYAGKRHGFSNY